MESRLAQEFIKQLSPSSKRAIRVAFAVSNQLQHSAVETEHLLIGLNEKQEGVTNNFLTAFGYGEPDQLLPSLATFAGWQVDKELSIVQAKMNDGELSSLAYSADVLAIFEQAAEIAKGKGHGVIRARHLLTGVLAIDSAAATRWLKEIEVPVAATRDYLIDLPEDTNPSAEAFRALRPAPVEDPVVALALAQAGERTLLITARQHSGVTVSDTASGDPVGQPVKGVTASSQVTSIAVAERGTQMVLASGWNDGRLLLSDLLSGQQLMSTELKPAAPVTAVLFAQLDQGLVIVCGRADGRTYRWETRSGGLLGETGGSGPAIRAMAGGSAANRFMAVMGLDDGRLMRWDVSGDSLVGDPVQGHENGTLALAMVERDGRPSAVSGGGDQAIRLWDMEKGEQVGQPWRGHGGNITALAVSHYEGRQLVISGSSDGGLRIWDPETGQTVGEEHAAHAGSVNALATGVVDGQAVLFSGGDEQEVRTWHLAELVPRKRVGSKVEWKNDSPARIDLLRHRELAGVLARRLRRIHNDHPRHSFLIHVDGPWGSGKSTLLGFLGRILDPEMALSEPEEAEAASATQGPASGKAQDDSGQADRPADWMVIWFDAWRQEGIGPPWWTLLASLREQMDRRRSWGERTLLRLRESLFKIRLAGSSYLLAIIIMLLLLAGIYLLFRPLFGQETLSLDGIGDTAKTISAVVGALVILWTGARVASKFFLWDSAKGAQIFEQSTRDPMQSAAEHFSWLLYQVGKPVVFFVDDLDRCDETYVVKLLESIQTLIRDVHLKEAQGQSGLSNPPSGEHRKKASYGPHFIVAADGAWIRKSFAKSFENFTGAVDEPGRPLGYLFLDKLFQITVPMPYLSPELQRRYFGGLLGVSGNGSEGEQGDDEEDIEEEVAAAVQRVQASDSDAEVMQVFRDASDQVRSRIAGPVVRRLTDEEVETAREHELQKFAELLDPNPRSMKRFLNAYSIMLSIQPLQLNAVSVDTLALWTVLRLRWPALADYLLASPKAIEDVSRDGPVPENVPAQVRDLFSDPAVIRVVNFEKGGPLTPAAIREVASLASPAAEESEAKPNGA